MQEFEGCGVKVRFNLAAFLTERPPAQKPAEKAAPNGQATVQDLLRARLGDVDPTIAALMEQG